MKIAVYSSKKYDIDSFTENNTNDDLKLLFLEVRLDKTTLALAADHDAVCIFVNDTCDSEVLEGLANLGVKYVALRCAGFNNVDLAAAKRLNIHIVRVPAYSPEAVAEFAVGMIMTIVRKYHKAYTRVREGNFLLDGLLGFNLKGKTIGIIGTGKIGLLAGKILSRGFESNVIAYDIYHSDMAAEYGITYVNSLEELLNKSDIVSLHCPLLPSTRYLINEMTLGQMKKGAYLINTSRGALIDTRALIGALKTGHLGAVGLDVYEKESAYFFIDGSSKIIHDDNFARLLSFYNVFVSGHQAFLTVEALKNIAETTLNNLEVIARGELCANIVELDTKKH